MFIVTEHTFVKHGNIKAYDILSIYTENRSAQDELDKGYRRVKKVNISVYSNLFQISTLAMTRLLSSYKRASSSTCFYNFISDIAVIKWNWK